MRPANFLQCPYAHAHAILREPKGLGTDDNKKQCHRMDVRSADERSQLEVQRGAVDWKLGEALVLGGTASS